MNDATAAFQQVLAAYQAAVLARDAAAFAALYDDEVHVFDMWGNWCTRGIAAWRAMADGWFGSLGSESVRVDVADAAAQGTADFAVGHATLTFTAFSAAGDELRSLDNRLTMALRHAGDRWVVVHEHTSAPIEPGTLRPLLRKPLADGK